MEETRPAQVSEQLLLAATVFLTRPPDKAQKRALRNVPAARGPWKSCVCRRTFWRLTVTAPPMMQLNQKLLPPTPHPGPPLSRTPVLRHLLVCRRLSSQRKQTPKAKEQQQHRPKRPPQHAKKKWRRTMAKRPLKKRR